MVHKISGLLNLQTEDSLKGIALVLSLIRSLVDRIFKLKIRLKIQLMRIGPGDESLLNPRNSDLLKVSKYLVGWSQIRVY